MSPSAEPRQRIAQLAPISDVYALVDRITAPVAACDVDPAEAVGCVLAADVVATIELPRALTAVRDGWAVRADLIADAGPYAPMPLIPPPCWVDYGDPLPGGCDAVLPADGLAAGATGTEAVAAVGPGEGVAPPGFECVPGAVLRRAGDRLRAVDIALLRAAGAESVSVRIPRFAIIGTDTPGADSVTPLLTHVIAAAGAAAVRLHAPAHQLAAALSAIEADALVIVGGAGEGRHDRSALALADAGELLMHGMGIRPGESAGLGTVGTRPVLLLQRRLDAALAAWLMVGRRMLGRLSRQEACQPLPQARLIRKIVSTIGLAEMVLVEHDGGSAWPLASGIFPLSAVGRAAGWVLVPPESEGYPEGTLVDVNALP